MFQQKAPISNVFSSFFIIFIEIWLFFKIDSAGRKAGRIERRETILSFVFTFVMHHIIIIADGVHIDVCAPFDTTHPSSFLHSDRVTFAQWALHQRIIMKRHEFQNYLKNRSYQKWSKSYTVSVNYRSHFLCFQLCLLLFSKTK